MGINLALGILYTWSMFKDAIKTEFGWQGDHGDRIDDGVIDHRPLMYSISASSYPMSASTACVCSPSVGGGR